MPGGIGPGAMAAFCFSVLLPSSTQTLLIPALPRLQDEHGFSVAECGWTLSAFLVGASLSAPLVGRAGDVWGRRPLAVASGLLHVLGALVCWVGCDDGTAVAVGRGLQGFSAGVYVLHISAVQQLVTDPVRRASRIGLLTASVAAGPAVGFLAGGIVSERLGVPATFVLGAVAGAVATLMLWLWTPASGGTSGARVDLGGALLLAAALVSTTVWVAQASTSGAASSPGWPALAAVSWVALLVWSARRPDPFLDPRVLRERTSALGHLAGALSAAAMFGLFVVVPLVVQDPRGLDLGPIAAGLVLAPGAVAMLLVGPWASRAGVRRGFAVVIVAGNALCAGGLVALALTPGPVTVVAVLATVTALGVGVAFPALPSIVMAAAPRAAVGAAAGVNSMVRGMGSAIGAQLALAVAASGGGSFAGAFAVSALFAVGACVLATAVGRPGRGPAGLDVT